MYDTAFHQTIPLGGLDIGIGIGNDPQAPKSSKSYLRFCPRYPAFVVVYTSVFDEASHVLWLGLCNPVVSLALVQVLTHSNTFAQLSLPDLCIESCIDL